MVDKVADDGVEPKPAKKEGSDEGSGDVKPSFNFKPFKVQIPIQARIGKIQEPNPVPTGVICEARDTASFFTTNARWREREELLTWVRGQGVKAGFGVCIDKSVIKRPYLTMQCERSGVYKPPKTRKKPNLEGIGSRKCNCPFRLKGFFDKDTNDWWLAMLCGMHNHDLEVGKLQGHLIAGRLRAEEKKKVIEMTKSLTVPRNILTNLKENNNESVTTIKQVYNVRTRWRKGERGDMTELQFLISKLVEHKYVYYTRCNSEETTLEDIFFAHPESIKLLNTFPTVLVMDSTYKTNNYRMPLFEIVGCTSTKMTYSVGFAFLHFELEDNFAWALTMLKGLLYSKDNMPKVIVTDRDGALMKAVGTVFPETYTMLCYFHIGKNVRSKCITDCKVVPKPPKGTKLDKKELKKNKMKNSDVVEKVVNAWRELVESPTEESYASNLLKFKEVCMPFPEFIKYVEETVLNLKEKFVRAWTDKVLHLGCRTTNIVESAHGVLKKYLRSSMGDLASCWDEIHKMLAVQFGEIQGSFGRNKTVFEHKYKKIKMMKELEGYVSRKALRFIYDELKRSKTFGFGEEDCGCVQKTSYGLPCACIIAMKSKQKLPLVLDDIYPHWKRLCVQGEKIDDDFSVMEEWNGIQELLKKSPYNMKLHIKEMMRQIAFPETTFLSPPLKKVVTKGAPKRKRTTLKVSSTGRIPSRWETIDSQNPDSQPSQPKRSLPKRKDARLGTYSRSQASSSTSKPFWNIPYI